MRNPAVAGLFYPAEKSRLVNEVSSFLSQSKKAKIDGVLKALIVPHAGYPYSGPVAGSAYSLLKKGLFKKVVILGPSHFAWFEGASISSQDFLTPIGVVKCADPKKWLSETVKDIPATHLKEHSIEVQLPFLQVCLGDFELSAICVGDAKYDLLAKEVIRHCKDSLIIASSDLSHYFPYDQAVKQDKKTISHILSLNFSDIDACGKIPVLTLMKVASDLGWKSHLLDYRNSGDTAGDRSRVVGYCAIAFTGDKDETS